jgi:hypothetical protein
LNTSSTTLELETTAEFEAYREARAIAAEIADLEGLDRDLVFSDAMHVAVALALEAEDMPYTGANAAWMFDRICPCEVREILTYRRDYPEAYDGLPKAGALENLTAVQMEAAGSLTQLLKTDWLNAMFFSESYGTA